MVVLMDQFAYPTEGKSIIHMTIIYQKLTSEAFTSLLPELARIYTEAFSGPPYHKPAAELDSFPEEAGDHRKRPGFQAWAAFALEGDRSLGSPVGFAYCYRLLPQYWWYQQVEPHLRRLGQEFWLQDAFELTQIAVTPEFQEQGIGAGLHDRLLAGLSYRHGLLSTLYAETAATALYRRRDWQVLLEPFEFTGVSRPYRIMGKNF
jgi:GNAT superfamily N-acetyltransferase